MAKKPTPYKVSLSLQKIEPVAANFLARFLVFTVGVSLLSCNSVLRYPEQRDVKEDTEDTTSFPDGYYAHSTLEETAHGSTPFCQAHDRRDGRKFCAFSVRRLLENTADL